jgi:hypothetical protein
MTFKISLLLLSISILCHFVAGQNRNTTSNTTEKTQASTTTITTTTLPSTTTTTITTTTLSTTTRKLGPGCNLSKSSQIEKELLEKLNTLRGQR